MNETFISCFGFYFESDELEACSVCQVLHIKESLESLKNEGFICEQCEKRLSAAN